MTQITVLRFQCGIVPQYGQTRMLILYATLINRPLIGIKKFHQFWNIIGRLGVGGLHE